MNGENPLKRAAENAARLLPVSNPDIQPLLGGNGGTTLLNRAFERLQNESLVIGEKTGKGKFDPIQWTWIGAIPGEDPQPAAGAPESPESPESTGAAHPVPRPADAALLTSLMIDPDSELEQAITSLRQAFGRRHPRNDLAPRLLKLSVRMGIIEDELRDLAQELEDEAP